MKTVLVALILFSATFASAHYDGHDYCDPRDGGRGRHHEGVWTRVINHGSYLELRIENNTDVAYTCQGDLVWRYVGSYSDLNKGIYSYVQPGQRSTVYVTIYKDILYARPEVKCN